MKRISCNVERSSLMRGAVSMADDRRNCGDGCGDDSFASVALRFEGTDAAFCASWTTKLTTKGGGGTKAMVMGVSTWWRVYM